MFPGRTRSSRAWQVERLVAAILCLSVCNAWCEPEFEKPGSVALGSTSRYMWCVHGDRTLTSHKDHRDMLTSTRGRPGRHSGITKNSITKGRQKKEKEETRTPGEKGVVCTRNVNGGCGCSKCRYYATEYNTVISDRSFQRVKCFR